jgi:hypothetical protein
MKYKHTLINTQTDYIVVDFDIDSYKCEQYLSNIF